MEDCIEFQGYRGPQGYGRKWKHGKLYLAHRLAWEEVNGPIGDGLCVLHTCDNPPCLNVEHLFLGTRADNNADKIQKGRQGSWNKLTPDNIRVIKMLAIRGRGYNKNGKNGITNKELAIMFNVKKSTIGEVVSGRNWKALNV